MVKKIAIIGTASNLVDAPYSDESWEIWGLNGAYQSVPRYTRWFDMHDLSILKKYHLPEYFDFLRATGDKLMMNKKYDELPEAKVFPAVELVKKYGRYFTNTVAWLIALAMEEGADEIGIWGVNMASDTEYGSQRPSCEYFIGLARGRGIKVTVPDDSEMLKCSWLYGIEGVPAIIAKLPDKKREIQGNQSEIFNQIDNLQGRVNYINGYVEGADSMVIALKDKHPEILEDAAKYLSEKQESLKKESDAIQSKVKELLSQKHYLDGAMALLQYFNLNWGR